MRRKEAVVVAIGAAVLLLHALFPPRWKPDSQYSVTRGFIFSDDFYMAGYVHHTEGPFEGFTTCDPVRLDYDRFLTLSIIICAATIWVVIFLHCLRVPQRQVQGTSDVPPTPPAESEVARPL